MVLTKRSAASGDENEFSTVFCPAVNPCACTGLHRRLHRVWACQMDDGSLNSFSIIILNNHFDPFIRCMLLREKCCHSLFIRTFTKPEREEVTLNDVSYFQTTVSED